MYHGHGQRVSLAFPFGFAHLLLGHCLLLSWKSSMQDSLSKTGTYPETTTHPKARERVCPAPHSPYPMLHRSTSRPPNTYTYWSSKPPSPPASWPIHNSKTGPKRLSWSCCSITIHLWWADQNTADMQRTIVVADDLRRCQIPLYSTLSADAGGHARTKPWMASGEVKTFMAGRYASSPKRG